MTLENYLLDFGLPDEEYTAEFNYDKLMIAIGRFFPAYNTICPVCGGNHYMPMTVSAPLNWQPEQYRRQLEDLCRLNRGAFYVTPYFCDPLGRIYGRQEDDILGGSSTAVNR